MAQNQSPNAQQQFQQSASIQRSQTQTPPPPTSPPPGGQTPQQLAENAMANLRRNLIKGRSTGSVGHDQRPASPRLPPQPSTPSTPQLPLQSPVQKVDSPVLGNNSPMLKSTSIVPDREKEQFSIGSLPGTPLPSTPQLQPEATLQSTGLEGREERTPAQEGLIPSTSSVAPTGPMSLTATLTNNTETMNHQDSPPGTHTDACEDIEKEGTPSTVPVPQNNDMTETTVKMIMDNDISPSVQRIQSPSTAPSPPLKSPPIEALPSSELWKTTINLTPPPPSPPTKASPPSPPPQYSKTPSIAQPTDTEEKEPISSTIASLSSLIKPSTPPPPRPPAVTPSVVSAVRTGSSLATEIHLEAIAKIFASLPIPLDDLTDLTKVEAHLQGLCASAQSATATIESLTLDLSRAQDGLDSVREVHALELNSLRGEKDRMADVIRGLEKESDTLREKFKEEEEKRIKSVNLLKAVRQKLVKADKDVDDLNVALKKKDEEAIILKAEKENTVIRLRTTFEKEIDEVKKSHERELNLRKGQQELEIITMKAAQTRELKTLQERVQELERDLKEERERSERLASASEIMKGEVETAVAEKEAEKAKASESEWAAREAKDKLMELEVLLEEGRKEGAGASSREEVHSLVAQHNEVVSTLQERLRIVEKERRESEEEMGKNLRVRIDELERLRREMRKKDAEYEESVGAKRAFERIVEGEKASREAAEKKRKEIEAQMEIISIELEDKTEKLASTQEALSELMTKMENKDDAYSNLESSYNQLRTTNKNLQDKLRRVQSSLFQSEQNRNPGVGYFSTFSRSSSNLPMPSSPPPQPPLPLSASTSTFSPTTTQTSFPSVSGGSDVKTEGKQDQILNGTTATISKEDEALNFEYLRNVIIQFLDKKEMRPHLVSVLGTVLHFTPQEVRRLKAKVSTS